jgi:hypothetical protein
MEPSNHHPREPGLPTVSHPLPPPPRLARHRPGRRRLLGHVPLVVWLLCLAGFGLLGLTLWRAGSSWAITWFGVTVPGEVTGKLDAPERGVREGRLTFTYHVRDVEYSAEDTVDEDALDALQVGAHIKVRVLMGWPDRPQLVEPSGHAGRGRGIWLGLALLGNVALWILFRRCLRKPLRQRALVREGVATEGVIVRKEVRGGRRRSWAVQFSYRAPRYGVAHEGSEPPAVVADKEWQVRMRVGWADFEAAQVGAAVTVLYDPKQPSRSLIYPFADYEAVSTPSEPGAA